MKTELAGEITTKENIQESIHISALNNSSVPSRCMKLLHPKYDSKQVKIKSYPDVPYEYNIVAGYCKVVNSRGYLDENLKLASSQTCTRRD